MSNAKELSFGVDEYQQRLKRLHSEMETEFSVDVALVHTPENVFYLTGHHTMGYYMYQCGLIRPGHEPRLVLRRGEAGNARTLAWIDDLVPYDDNDNPVAVTARVLTDMGLSSSRIGVELGSWFLTPRNYKALTELLPEARFVDITGMVERGRAIKSANEIDRIRAAARMASKAMLAGMNRVQIGTTDNHIAGAIFGELLAQGSEYLAMEPFVAVAPGSGSMHATWSGRQVEPGRPTLLEVAGCYHRYHAASMRTVVMGEAPAEITRMAQVCEEALDVAIDAVRPGITSGEVHAALQKVIDSHGYTEQFRKRTGYSMGIAFGPDWGEGHFLSLRADDPTVLQPNMVFHIPPALRVFGSGGVGFSETILITDSGNEILTSVPRDLCW